MRAVSAFLIIMTAALLSGCVSPGKPYTYLDIKFAAVPVATPVQPAVNQATVVGFSVRNTFNQTITGIAWSATLVDSLGNTVGFPFTPSSGTVDVPAFGSVAQSISFTPTAAGVYTLTVTLDPLNAIAERDETDNVATTTIVVADHDLAFALPLPTIVDSSSPSAPHSSDPLTLTFAVSDTLNPGHTGLTTVTASYQILLNGVALAIGPSSPSSPFTIDGAASSPQLVTVTLPATGSAGTFAYTINLATVPPEAESNTANNTINILFTIAAGN